VVHSGGLISLLLSPSLLGLTLFPSQDIAKVATYAVMKKYNLFNYNNVILVKGDAPGTVGEIGNENEDQGTVEKGGKLEMSRV
jgi:hypothetical protein